MEPAPSRPQQSPLPGRGTETAPSRWWNAAPWALFALLAAWKLTFVRSASVGFGTYDEIVYFKYATQLAQGHMFKGAEYPWLYPLSLVPAFLHHNPHAAAIALSAVYSATLVFPVWLIAREILGPRHATVVAALTCLMPFHYVLGRALMSEEIYFPMLMSAVYLVTTERWRRHELLRDVLTGLLAGAMYATRYLTVPILPALVLAWWLRERAHAGRALPSARALGRLALAGAVGLAAFVPWLVAAVGAGTPLRAALGLEIARSKLAADVHPTLGGFFMYGALYIAAWVLSVGPLLAGVGFAIARAVREGARDALGRLTIVTGGLAAFLLVILTRHSWLATYNYPEPLRIMVRYGIYVTALGLILGYAGLVTYLRSHAPSARAVWAVVLAGPAVAIAAAYWLQLGAGILPDMNVSVDGGAGDVSHVVLMGWRFWPVVLGTLAAVALLAARRDRRAVAVLVAGAVVFFAIGVPAYLARLDEFRAYQVIAARIAALEKARHSEIDPVKVALTPQAVKLSGLTERGFYKSLAWNLHYFIGHGVISAPLREMPDPTYIVYAASSYDGTGTPVEVDGDRYVVRFIPPK